MRQKELRIALVCYGGISLAVYMHGVTKEIWHAARASRDFLAGKGEMTGTAGVYLRLLRHIEARHGLRLRVMTDIIAGASAGGINGVFLAQALHSGQSLDPITRLWLERADVDALTDPEARPWWRFAKFWAMPLVWFALTRPGNMISASVAPETRRQVLPADPFALVRTAVLGDWLLANAGRGARCDGGERNRGTSPARRSPARPVRNRDRFQGPSRTIAAAQPGGGR
jgi:patatin-related protein